ncbi:MAG: hypothetical protein LBF80_00215 [Spirochaetaceae bacterium]|nr:hypothetical protein [Spirochaetaceae bacterium]
MSIGKNVADIGRVVLVYGIIIVYVAQKLSGFIRRRFGGGIFLNSLYILILAAALILTGLSGNFAVIMLSAAIIGIGDGFGTGVQNNYFLTLPAIANLHSSRSLSLFSFL